MNKRYLEMFREMEHDRESGTNLTRDSHLLIIDGLNTYIRVFSAVPALNDDGDHVGGVTGFLRSVASVIRQHKPTRCIIVFDGKGGSRRRKDLYPSYKANRANKTAFNRHKEFASLEDEQASMKRQYSRLVEYLKCLPVSLLSVDHVEADDMIAYIANELYIHDSQRVTICSTDRDFLQLVNNRISVWSPVKKCLYTPTTMHEEFGFDAKNYLLYRAFTGDKSDNIPGIDGVGGKSLVKYFPMFSEPREISINELVDYASSVEKPYKVHERVCENKMIIERNLQLMQLKQVDIDGRTKAIARDVAYGNIDRINILEFKKMFMADKMYTVIKDLDSWLASSFNTLNAYSTI